MDEAYRFRPATVADIAAAHALIESGYRGDSARRGWTHEADLLGGQRTDREALADIIADPEQTLLLAERGARLVGCVLIADEGEREGDRIAYLGMLTVDPELQSQGLGRRLIAEAEIWARDRYAATIMEMTVISRRVELVEWYVRRGYARTGRQAPFPVEDPRFGLPKVEGLVFDVLAKRLG